MQAPALKNLIRKGLAHKGFAFIEVLSDCTEIYGRKNDLGSSPEMILSQRSGVRPESYGNTVDLPFRPNALKTGVLARNERPEYAQAYRDHLAARRDRPQSPTGGGHGTR